MKLRAASPEPCNLLLTHPPAGSFVCPTSRGTDLNDMEHDDAGGATNFTELFPAVDAVRPKLGRLLLWPNVHDAAPRRRNLAARHEALPVRAGRKHAANVWLQQCARGVRHRACEHLPDEV